MLKRATKGQIIKKINTQEAFIRSEALYIPVILDKESCVFFNVESIVATFLPVNFIKPEKVFSNFAKNKNNGFTKLEKPLFIKTNAKNSNYFEENNIENTSTNNSFYKKVYSKNIVSSFGQNDFIKGKTTILFEDDNNDEIDLIIRTNINSIKQKTCISMDEYTQCYKMIIKFYALNKKNEVIDSLEIKSKPVDEYLKRDIFSSDVILESDLDLFAKDYSVVFRPYTDAILSNINENESIKGPALDFDNNKLNSIFKNTNNIKSTEVTLNSNTIGKSLIVSRFNSKVFNNLDSLQDRNTSRRLIQDKGFTDFILEAKKNIDVNKKETLDIEYNFNIIRNENNINSFKKSSISKTLINQLYRNILSYNFEKDLTSEKVINLEISKLNNNLLESIENIYKIKINIDTENYQKDQILQSSISFNFFDNSYNKITKIENFYFDESISESNKISGSLISLDSLFYNKNSITLYIKNENPVEQNIIRKCELVFHKNNTVQPTSIGIFSVDNYSNKYVNKNNSLFEECAIKLGKNVKTNFNTQGYINNLLIQQINTADSFELNIGNILGDISFKNIEYFSSSTNQSVLERLSEVINNTLIKVTKYIKINNLELNEVSQYYFLNEITSEITSDNKIIIDTSKVDVMKFDIKSKLLTNLEILNNYNNISIKNYSDVKGNFNVDYKICLGFAVLKNNTAIKFGNTNNNDQSKNNLISFVSSNNKNFQMSKVVNIISEIYSSTFFEKKESLIKEIYKQSDIIESISFEQEFISSIEDFIVGEDTFVNEFNSNIFTSEIDRIDDLNFVNIESFRSNILLDFDLNSFLLKKNDKSKKLLKLSGNNVKNIIESFNIYENSSILRSFCKVEYQFKNIELSNSDINLINNAGFKVIKSNKDKNCMFLFKKEDENSLPISISLTDDSIFCDIIRENKDFKKFSSNSYYDQILNLVGNSSSIVIKNITLRICIVFNINGNHNILLLNTNLQPSRKLIRYINSNFSYQENYLNLDVFDQNKKLFKPSVIYKGSSI